MFSKKQTNKKFNIFKDNENKNMTLWVISQNYILIKFLKNLKGFSKYLFFKFETQLECPLIYEWKNYKFWQKLLFLQILIKIIPEKFTINQRVLLQIFILEHTHSYKGWRHLFGLPVRGQRTWSNNKTIYRLTNFFKKFKFMCLQQRFLIKASKFSETALMAEHINQLWYFEWFEEWNSANQEFIQNVNKNKFFKFKIDYKYLLNFQVKTPWSRHFAKKKKKEKKFLQLVLIFIIQWIYLQKKNKNNFAGWLNNDIQI